MAGASLPPRAAAPSASGPRSYPCPTCRRVFNKKANLKVHSRKHTGEKPYACPVPRCGKRFMWKSSVTFHEANCTAGGAAAGGGGGAGVPAPGFLALARAPSPPPPPPPRKRPKPEPKSVVALLPPPPPPLPAPGTPVSPRAPLPRMPIAMDLGDSDEEDGLACGGGVGGGYPGGGAGGATASARGREGRDGFLRTGNPFTGFAPRCSPLPAASPLVASGLAAMPLSPLFCTTSPPPPEHRFAPDPIEPCVSAAPGSAGPGLATGMPQRW